MAKKIEIDIEVKSQSVVDAKDNVDGLNNSIKDTEKTTKDFGKSITIEYDKVGNATDVLVDKEMSLTKQIRAVKAQMEILTATGKGQSQEFTILQRKFNDLNDNLGKNKLRSQELFGTLSMLPGPVGDFAQQLQGAVDLLKTFSGYKLSDIRNQVSALGDDLKEIIKGFLGIGAAKAAASAGGEVAGTAVGAGVGSAVGTAAGAGAAALAASQVNLASMTNAVEIANKAVSNLGKNFNAQVDILKTVDGAITDIVVSYTLENGEIELLTANQVKNIAASKTQIVTYEALAVAETELIVTTTLLQSIMSAGIFLAIAAAIAAIGVAIYKILPGLLNYTRETKENISATDAFTAALKREQEALALDLSAIDLSVKALQTRAQIAGESEQKILDITIQGSKDKLKALRDYDDVLYNEQRDATKREGLTAEQRKKLLEDINAKIIQNGRDINKQIMETEQIKQDGILSIQQKGYTNYLAELDAKIQLEIDKDKTGGERLQQLIDERAKKVIEHEKLYGKAAEAQRELMRKNGLKKTQEALDEDTKRVQAYQSRIGDIYNAAILDNQLRDETARKKKLNDDINAIKLDTEFRKKGIIEQQVILKELELGYENDLVKIRETYFLKKFQKIDEEKTLEIQKKKQIQDNKLALNELELKQDKDNYQLLHFNLSEYYKQRMVDMSLANQVEHDNTQLQLTSELDQLKIAYDSKNLTQEEYENKKKEINRRIGENDQQLVDKQIALDRTLIEAKKATAQATMDIANNLVGLLSALGEFSTDWQITAAIAEAGLGIAKIIISTQVAIAEFSASVAGLGPIGAAMATAYAIKEKIAAGIGIAAITVGAIGRINAIKAQGAKSSSTTAAAPSMGKNYGDGGMIDGPRHAGGGVMINAEGGEAVMTRGAVTMFQPLLSMLNQAGGGTSFSKGAVGQASFDNPQTQIGQMEQPIIKTYVVENELTTIQHRTARLKDLSTL